MQETGQEGPEHAAAADGQRLHPRPHRREDHPAAPAARRRRESLSTARPEPSKTQSNLLSKDKHFTPRRAS